MRILQPKFEELCVVRLSALQNWVKGSFSHGGFCRQLLRVFRVVPPLSPSVDDYVETMKTRDNGVCC